MQLNESVHRAVTRRVAAPRRLGTMLERSDRPEGSARTEIVGRDPLRVLAFGAGLFAGYGVTSWSDSLGGRLARELGEHLGRGVILERRVTPNVPIREAKQLLGASGAHLVDLVLWSPSFTDTAGIWRRPGWAKDLDEVLRYIMQTGPERTLVAVLEAPTLTGLSPIERAGTVSVRAVNRLLRRVTARVPGTLVVVPPPLEPMRRGSGGARLLTADYYRHAAQVVAPLLVHALRGPGAAPSSSRQTVTGPLRAATVLGATHVGRSSTTA